MRSISLRAAALGIGLLMLAGCGGKRTPEAMVKEQIELTNAMAAEYERQSAPLDPAALGESVNALAKVETDLKALREELDKITAAEYHAALAKHRVENKKANARLRAAKDAKNGVKK